MKINNKHDIGDTVYLINDKDQLQRFVTQINIRQGGLLYCLSQCGNDTWHYDFEITETYDLIKATSN